MERYAVVYEQTETGWSAYAPGLPGLGVAGATLAEAARLMCEGIEIYNAERKNGARRK